MSTTTQEFEALDGEVIPRPVEVSELRTQAQLDVFGGLVRAAHKAGECSLKHAVQHFVECGRDGAPPISRELPHLAEPLSRTRWRTTPRRRRILRIEGAPGLPTSGCAIEPDGH